MPIKLVADGETGGVREVEKTAEEIAQDEIDRQEAAAWMQAEDARETKLRQARPANGIIAKIRDGTELTAVEMQRVVRYLALRELREARG